ncbi:MAG: hypothetical protein MUC51_19525 [Anaerolineae bacterium]|nr:hypothetical protein [Anaerolineae bacterium]
MTPRIRKLTGAILLLFVIAIYSLLAMLAAVILQVNEASGGVELLYDRRRRAH